MSGDDMDRAKSSDPITPVLVQGDSAAHVATVRTLFLEYAASLNISLCFQGFENEIAALPGDYSPTRGRLYLAIIGDQPAACIALRPIDPRTCEMKRLYVRPAYRGRGMGRRLAVMLVDEARAIGYTSMRLDTLPVMTEAVGLYESMGFRRIEPYRHNPVPGAIYMELTL